MANKNMAQILIDWESWDRLTVDNLKEYRRLLKRQLREHKRGEGYLHPDDVENTPKLIKALDIIIKQYT